MLNIEGAFTSLKLLLGKIIAKLRLIGTVILKKFACLFFDLIKGNVFLFHVINELRDKNGIILFVRVLFGEGPERRI